MKIKLFGCEFDVSGEMCASAGCASLVGLMAFSALAFGQLPFFGGFASASETKAIFDRRLIMIDGLDAKMSLGFLTASKEREDLRAKIQQSQDSVMARITAGNIIALNMRYCEALQARQRATAFAYSNQIGDLQVEYKRYLGSEYPLRPCP